MSGPKHRDSSVVDTRFLADVLLDGRTGAPVPPSHRRGMCWPVALFAKCRARSKRRRRFCLVIRSRFAGTFSSRIHRRSRSFRSVSERPFRVALLTVGASPLACPARVAAHRRRTAPPRAYDRQTADGQHCGHGRLGNGLRQEDAGRRYKAVAGR